MKNFEPLGQPMGLNRSPKLPSELAKHGIFTHSKGYAPKVGDEIDFYEPKNGAKWYGLVTFYDGEKIKIRHLSRLSRNKTFTFKVQLDPRGY